MMIIRTCFLWVGSVLYISCTTHHNRRLGFRWPRSWSIWSVQNIEPRQKKICTSPDKSMVGQRTPDSTFLSNEKQQKLRSSLAWQLRHYTNSARCSCSLLALLLCIYVYSPLLHEALIGQFISTESWCYIWKIPSRTCTSYPSGCPLYSPVRAVPGKLAWPKVAT